MKNVFKLSLYNFAAYKKIYVKIICALIALLFLITLISSFTLSVNAKQTELLNKAVSSNCTIGSTIPDKKYVPEDFDTIKLKRISRENICKELFDDKSMLLTTNDFAVDFQGTRYYSGYYNDYFGIFEPYVAEEKLFTQNDYREAGQDANFLIGRLPVAHDEVALARFILNSFELTDDVIGQEITLTAVKRVLKDEQTTPNVSRNDVIVNPNFKYEYVDLPFSMTVTVCGILTSDYYYLSGRNVYFCPSVLVAEGNALTKFGAEDCYLCSFDEWVSKQTADYFDDNGITYLGWNHIDQINVTVNLQTVVNQLVLYFGSALLFGIVLTLALLCEKLCAAQMKNSGVMLMSGMTNKRLFCVWLLQLAFASVISLIVASLLSFGAFIGINAIISRTFWLSLTVSASTFFQIAGIGFAAVGIVTVAALGYFALIFRRKQTRELLDA